MVLLEHEAYVVAQEVGVIFPQVHAVKQDASAVRLIELVKEVDHGTLSCTGEAHKGRYLAALDVHIYVPEGLGSVRVCEVHVADAEVALHFLRAVVAALLGLLVRVKDVKEAFGIDEGVVHIVKDAVELGDGGGDVGEEHYVVHNLSNCHSRVADEHQVGGEYDDEHGAELADEVLESVVIERSPAHKHLVVSELGLDVPLLLAFYLLAVEGLDHVDALYDVHHAVALDFTVAAHIAAPAVELAGLAYGDPDIDGHYSKRCETNVDIGPEHKDEGQDGAGEQRKEVYEKVLYRAGKAADALVYPGLELSGIVVRAGEEGHPEGEDLVYHGLGEVL